MNDFKSVIKQKDVYFVYGKNKLGRFCFGKLKDCLDENSRVYFIETESDNLYNDKGEGSMTPERARKMSEGRNVQIFITGTGSAQAMKQNCLNAGFFEDELIFAHGFMPYLNQGYFTQINSVCLWPPIKNDEVDLYKKIAWYIPERVKVNVITSGKNKIPLGSNVNVFGIEKADELMQSSDYILIWDMDHEDELFNRYPGKVRDIDRFFFEYIDTYNYERVFFCSFSKDERKEFKQDSINTFHRLKKELANNSEINIFCSGPSISEIYDMDDSVFKDRINMICNSMVKDKDLMDKLKPRIITFIDTNFFFSPTAYGKAFYKDLKESFEKYGFYVIVRESQKPLFLYHCPEMQGKVIGVDSAGNHDFCFLDDNLFTKGAANILTEIMLPLASAISDRIYIAGCTGRVEGENYFWQHNGRVQYLDLKPSVFEMWPAFFHYRNYESYYKDHCRLVDEFLRLGESYGKTYYNMTSSFIPALKERSIV